MNALSRAPRRAAAWAGGGLILVLVTFQARPRPDFCTGERAAAWAPLAVAHSHVAHSHNDYAQPRPLALALERGIASVEADVWFDDGRFPVSHLGVFSKGTLAELYLEPLQARVSRDGFVLEKGKPFFLWLDIKSGNAALPAQLVALLRRYRIFDPRPEGAAVVVVLTGNEQSKRAISSRPDGFARDENAITEIDPGEVKGWEYYSLSWRDYATDARQLTCLVNHAHRLGRRVRFYGAPDTAGVWRLQKAAGVDFVAGDDLAGLSNVMAAAQ